MTRALDDDTLEQLVRSLARLHLEVERGLRSKDNFARHMPPSAQLPYLAGQTPDSRIPGRTVTDADVRAVRVQTMDSGRIYATAVTSTTEGRNGSLCFVLEHRQRKVALLQAVRLKPRGDYSRPSPGSSPPGPADVVENRSNLHERHDQQRFGNPFRDRRRQ